MLRRAAVRFGASPSASGPVTFEAEKIAGQASKPLQRSSFAYKGSEKGGEVGARNEAAFIGYEAHEPRNLKEKFAMPDNVNLLTVMPILMAISFVTADTWGIFLWDMYARRHYKPVVIERPAQL